MVGGERGGGGGWGWRGGGEEVEGPDIVWGLWRRSLSFVLSCPGRVQGLLSRLAPRPYVELTRSRGSLVNTHAERSPLGGR